MNTCPVCGYDQMELPATEDGNICPSCGTEFGYDTMLYTVVELAARLPPGRRQARPGASTGGSYTPERHCSMSTHKLPEWVYFREYLKAGWGTKPGHTRWGRVELSVGHNLEIWGLSLNVTNQRWNTQIRKDGPWRRSLELHITLRVGPWFLAVYYEGPALATEDAQLEEDSEEYQDGLMQLLSHLEDENSRLRHEVIYLAKMVPLEILHGKTPPDREAGLDELARLSQEMDTYD